MAGLTSEQVDALLASDAYGALSAELRRAEVNHHDLDDLVPRRARARGFGDSDDIASVLHHRVATATARPAGSGRARRPPALIAGLIPHAQGITDPDIHQALTERRELIEQRATAVLDRDLTKNEPWTTALGPEPDETRRKTAWRGLGQVVAAYRDRYGITAATPLGTEPESDAQKIDAARADAALRRARQLTRLRPERQQPEQSIEMQRERSL